VAWNSALLCDMIYTQPVVHAFSQLLAPTLLLIGQLDTTAIGKDRFGQALFFPYARP